MKSAETIRAKFAALLASGSVPRSGCGKEFLKTIEPLLAGGVLVEERAGGGRRVAIGNREAFSRFLAEQFPASTSLIPSNRIEGVARFRDSKALGSDGEEVAFVRAWRAGALLQAGRPTEAERFTARYGVFGFMLEAAAPYSLHGKCALVENPAVFTHITALDLDIGLVLYGGGRASNRLIEWLGTMDSPDFELLHLPDYDPVGLSEHERLRRKLGARVRLYLPADIAERFARFSKRSLLDRPHSRALLASLTNCDSEEVQQVIELIQRHNGGLEQEALFVNLGVPEN